MIRAGIIAAGLGERLRPAAADAPKPLVPVGGKPLVHWTVAALSEAGAGSITVLLNSSGRAVREYLRSAFPRLEWVFLEKDTPSSWESFRLVCGTLAARSDRFLVSTVDAVARGADVARFASRALAADAEAALAVTPFVDDEKPLWADVDGDGWVRAIGDDSRERRWATCGLYGLSASLASAQAGRAHARLRDYWTALSREGRRIAGVVLEKTVDVDRPEDVSTAERFLEEAR